VSVGYATIPRVNMARLRRPTSIVLAIVSSVLLLVGNVSAGLVLGAVAVGAAWFPRLAGAPEPPDD
jgi:hypothetical protein